MLTLTCKRGEPPPQLVPETTSADSSVRFATGWPCEVVEADEAIRRDAVRDERGLPVGDRGAELIGNRCESCGGDCKRNQHQHDETLHLKPPFVCARAGRPAAGCAPGIRACSWRSRYLTQPRTVLDCVNRAELHPVRNEMTHRCHYRRMTRSCHVRPLLPGIVAPSRLVQGSVALTTD